MAWCPGQLSLAIPPWVDAISTCTSESWNVNKHTAQYTIQREGKWKRKREGKGKLFFLYSFLLT